MKRENRNGIIALVAIIALVTFIGKSNGKARDNGYSQGYQEGYEIGYDEWEKEGGIQSYDDGYKDGINQVGAFASSSSYSGGDYETGFDSGYEVGYAEGHSTGYDEGTVCGKIDVYLQYKRADDALKLALENYNVGEGLSLEAFVWSYNEHLKKIGLSEDDLSEIEFAIYTLLEPEFEFVKDPASLLVSKFGRDILVKNGLIQ